MRTLMLAVIAAAVTACGDGAPTGPDGPQPIRPTAAGTPTGPASTAEIGPAGGTIASSDGAITVTVPAGAVATATTFSIQPITNNAHGGRGTAYRLSPHGTTFTEPVRITFAYGEDEVAGTSASLLRLAYQDADGYWLMYSAEALEHAAGTLSVETTHFSDWSMVAGAQLLPSEGTLRVGTALELQVLDCWNETSEEEGDIFVPIGYDCQEGISAPSAREWAVNGTLGGNGVAGTVAEGPAGSGTAMYHAPAAVPAANPVAVSVKYTGLAPTDVATLVANITITDPVGSCAELGTIDVWNATLGLSYTFAGSNADGDQLSVSHWAEVTARLERVAATQLAASWVGPLQGGLIELDDSHVRPTGAGSITKTLVGGGAPVTKEPFGAQVRAYLNVDLVNCTYNVGMTPGVAATFTETGNAPLSVDQLLGSVRSDWRTLGDLTHLAGGGDFTAHSALWGSQNTGDAYFPDALGMHIFADEFAAEGAAGTARFEWSYQPED